MKKVRKISSKTQRRQTSINRKIDRFASQLAVINSSPLPVSEYMLCLTAPEIIAPPNEQIST